MKKGKNKQKIILRFAQALAFSEEGKEVQDENRFLEEFRTEF